MELNKEQIGFLNECTKGKWTLNEETGLVDIRGDFDCYRRGLTDFKGVKFGVVRGDFWCSHNKLTSLVGAPQKVEGDFWCSHNKLTSLVGAPQKVEGYFNCFYNSISGKTLELVWETMQEKKIDYWVALSILKSQIRNSDWKLLEGELDERLSKDAQKGISMLNKFKYFD